jgi:tetratricopeptide (TPR) repeat protein
MGNNVEFYLDRARESARERDYEAAIGYLSSALRIDPENFTACMQRGHLYAQKGLHTEAIADYTQAIRVAPQETLPYLYRGDLLAAHGNTAAACHDYQQILKIESQFKNARVLEYIATQCGTDT